MRILLVGEYSGFHNALKYGLKSLGHEVKIVGDGDGFKKYPVDISVDSDYFDDGWIKQKVRKVIHRLSGKDLRDHFVLARFRESENLLKDYDIVQFINSNAFNTRSSTESEMIDFLIKNNSKVVLVACGDDVPYAKYITEEHEGYSILDAYKKGHVSKKHFQFTTKYLQPEYVHNYNKIIEKAIAIIPSNTDFLMPLKQNKRATPIIPAAVTVDRFSFVPNENLSVIQIFMGINRHNYWKKGINYFEEALDQIKEKYNDRVEITIAEDLPYAEYITSYQKAHILLDQVLCYDQGYNALEAMAQGKVVFAGGSEAYLKAHQLEDIPVIDAQPDVDYLTQQLSQLIEEPQRILEIGQKARQHIIEYHDSIKVAQQYLAVYNS